MKANKNPDKCIDMPLYSDPYKELAYRVIERACLDAKGWNMFVSSDERTKSNWREEKRQAALKWINHSSMFEFYCGALGIEPAVVRKKINAFTPKAKIVSKQTRHVYDDIGDDMARLYKQGYQMQEIADRYHITVSAVSLRLKKRLPATEYRRHRNRGYNKLINQFA